MEEEHRGHCTVTPRLQSAVLGWNVNFKTFKTNAENATGVETRDTTKQVTCNMRTCVCLYVPDVMMNEDHFTLLGPGQCGVWGNPSLVNTGHREKI